jgi:hypothetical protein
MQEPKGPFNASPRTLESLLADYRLTVDDPALRPAVDDAVAMLNDPVTKHVLARLSPAERAKLFLTLRDACQSVFERKSCELCDRVATKIRLALGTQNPHGDPGAGIGPAGVDSWCLILILCDQCLALPRVERDRMIREFGARRAQQLAGSRRPTRRVIVGQRVGEGTNLPARSAIQTCELCGKSVWIDQDDLERYGESFGDPCHLCANCAEPLSASGRLEHVPSTVVDAPGRESP